MTGDGLASGSDWKSRDTIDVHKSIVSNCCTFDMSFVMLPSMSQFHFWKKWLFDRFLWQFSLAWFYCMLFLSYTQHVEYSLTDSCKFELTCLGFGVHCLGLGLEPLCLGLCLRTYCHCHSDNGGCKITKVNCNYNLKVCQVYLKLKRQNINGNCQTILRWCNVLDGSDK